MPVYTTMKFSTHASVILLSLLTLVSCEEKTGQETAQVPPKKEAPAPDSIEQTALRIITEHPNLAIIQTSEESIHFKNKYTELELELPFQKIIDGDYKVLAAIGEDYLKDPILSKKKKYTWGKTPEWIPRYPGAEPQYGAMHAPRPDGSIWGNINAVHPDSKEDIKAFLITQFTARGMVLDSESSHNGADILIFKEPNAEEEKRQVTYTLKRRGEHTRMGIQYSYGMP